MRRNRFVYIVGFVTLLLVIATLLLWMVGQPQRGPFFRLPDGTIATLQEVTYGKNHSFKSSTSGLMGLLGSDEVRLDTPNNSLVFWVSLRGESSDKDPEFVNQVAFDDQGHQIPQTEFNPLYSRSIRNFLGFDLEDKVAAFTLETFPRRSNIVGLRLYYKDHPTPIAEFTTPNPTPGPYPIWEAEPFPITRKKGNLTFALTNLVSEEGTYNSSSSILGCSVQTLASFNITRNGKTVKGWQPIRVTISDATGNLIIKELGPPLSENSYDKNGDIRVNIGGGLSTDEPAWKLRVEFSQTGYTDRIGDDIWVVRNIPNPNKGQIIELGASAVQKNLVLRLLSVSRPGAISGSPANSRYNTQAEVHATIPLSNNEMSLSLLAIDDKEREIIGHINGYMDRNQSNEREYSFSLNIPDDAKKLDMFFALHPIYSFEFLAKPYLSK